MLADLDPKTKSQEPEKWRAASSHRSVRLAVPRRGNELSTAAQVYGAPLRFAATSLGAAASGSAAAQIWNRLYARRCAEPGAIRARNASELASWTVVAAWTLGVTTGSIRNDATLLEAESWFLGDVAETGFAALVPDAARQDAERALLNIADPKALRELLPYILEPHGEGSRKSIRLRPETEAARARKRAEGVFYTPADIANYMVAGIMRPLSDDTLPLTVFDPACGSGVFLRAVLSELNRRSRGTNAFDLACSCLYGADIDPWAVNAAAFVLLADCFEDVRSREFAPIAAWHAIRLNLAHVDALRLDPGRALSHDDPNRIARLACRTELKSGTLPDVIGESRPAGSIEFQELFPELAEGPRLIIGNPPYADIGTRVDALSLSQRFETFRAAPRVTSDMFPLFVEQMTRLTAPNAHGGAMVLPLSIACNTGRQFVGLRRLLARTAGHWRFAFFDREPHALFGEDVKTRNSIVLWTRRGSDSEVQISTGPLRKWRGVDRARMFSSVCFTPVSVDITTGIPKVDGPLQAEALNHLLAQRNTLQHSVTHIGRATLAEAMRGDDRTVYVAGTAYNFLSTFLRPPRESLNGHEQLTENPMLALSCPTHDVALQVFAILNSSLAFWWWHVHGDGFHVSKHVVETIPLGEAVHSAPISAELARLGESMWCEVSATPIVSRNRGRSSFGFSAANSPSREKLDALLVEALGLGPAFAAELRNFCDVVTNARVAPRTKNDNIEMHDHEKEAFG